MNLIENRDTLHFFVQSNPNIRLLIPVWSSHKAHEWGTHLSFVYYRTQTDDGVINFNHVDASTLPNFPIHKLCNENTLVLGNRYVQSVGLDYEWVYFEEYGKPFNFSEWVETLFKGYRSDYNELNDCIPLMKWYELLQSIPDIQNRKSWYRIYSDSIKELGRLEGAGVKVEEEKFIDRFSFSPKNIYEGRVYTKYNPYTTTGRPSNRHLNVNYSALNKSDGSRECFVSRWDGGTLLQFDYESYHIRLIAKIVGYEFPKGETAHQHLANLYGTDYETAKALTFKYLYGGLDSLARDIPFFQIVDKYIKEVYQKFVISGVLKTPLYGREIHFTKIEGGTEQKVFNYLLQALETEVNYKKMSDILNEMSGMKSKLILYTYDAFLIDAHPMERDEILKLLPTIMEKGGFPVRIDEGINYNNLVHLG
jgi:hypothetical protein